MDFLRQQSIVANGKKRKFTVRMPPMSEKRDQAVLDWLQEERAAERVVAIQTFRKRPYKLLHCSKTFQQDFKASNTWLSRWTGRQCWLLKRDSQKYSYDYLSQIQQFRSLCANLQLKHSLNPLDHVCAGLTWYPMQPTTFVEKDRSVLHIAKPTRKGLRWHLPLMVMAKG